MNAELTWHNIAGGVVTVVKDGQILLCKGFGYADFLRRQTVVPDRTLFRPGSITKLLTGIAVMPVGGIVSGEAMTATSGGRAASPR